MLKLDVGYVEVGCGLKTNNKHSFGNVEIGCRVVLWMLKLDVGSKQIINIVLGIV